MDISFRPAQSRDLDDAARIVQGAYNDLRTSHGLAPTVPLRPPLFQGLCLAEGPEGLWIAEASGKTVGLGFAWVRQKFWYLAQLFVATDLQGKGVGQELLLRTLELAQRVGAENRALMTMAYNTASTGLYIRNGLYPREPLFRMAAPAAILEGTVGTGDLEATPMGPWSEAQEWVEEVDEEVLGFRRETHHAFLLEGVAARALRFERAGRFVGYAYVSTDGHIGPLAVLPGVDLSEVISAAVRCALEGKPNQVSMVAPGKAVQVLRTVSGLGFRVDEPFILLSARPFGDWGHYMPNNPGFM